MFYFFLMSGQSQSLSEIAGIIVDSWVGISNIYVVPNARACTGN